MGANTKERDLEAGFSEAETRCGTPAAPTPTYDNTPNAAPAEGMLGIKEFLPVITQKEHFVAASGEALSVGLGLGSAVGIWAVINETLKQQLTVAGRVHIANWVAGVIMGFILAPLLDKAARLFFGKTTTVLRKPQYTNFTRFLDDLIVISSALAAIGPMKGIQRQYGPFHTSVAFEYLVFVVGFTAYSFVRTFFFTVLLGHDYEREHVISSWARLPVELFWEYLDHFHHVYVFVTENLRDFLTFATYPYLADLWFAHWEVLDPEGKLAWVAHGLNIVFFFTYFSIIKETTYLIATPCWSPDLPHHHHHSL